MNAKATIRQQAQNLYNEGYSIQAIAEKLSLSYDAAFEALKAIASKKELEEAKDQKATLSRKRESRAILQSLLTTALRIVAEPDPETDGLRLAALRVAKEITKELRDLDSLDTQNDTPVVDFLRIIIENGEDL